MLEVNPVNLMKIRLSVTQFLGSSQKFCEETNRIESEAGRLPANWSYNLPTEAQWQLAAGDGTAPLSQTCWYKHIGSSRRIGLLAPNSFGLYDMKGNVKEWFWMYSLPTLEVLKRTVNDSGGFNHILRGGSWKSPSTTAESIHDPNQEVVTRVTTRDSELLSFLKVDQRICAFVLNSSTALFNRCCYQKNENKTKNHFLIVLLGLLSLAG